MFKCHSLLFFESETAIRTDKTIAIAASILISLAAAIVEASSMFFQSSLQQSLLLIVTS